MSRTGVSANATALPASEQIINRRTVLLGAAAVAIGATDVAVMANADPVHTLIKEYLAGVETYNSTCGDDLSNDEWDALAEKIYLPALRALSKPLPAITTSGGAKAALLLIRDETERFSESPVVPHLTDALLAWVGADV